VLAALEYARTKLRDDPEERAFWEEMAQEARQMLIRCGSRAAEPVVAQTRSSGPASGRTVLVCKAQRGKYQYRASVRLNSEVFSVGPLERDSARRVCDELRVALSMAESDRRGRDEAGCVVFDDGRRVALLFAATTSRYARRILLDAANADTLRSCGQPLEPFAESKVLWVPKVVVGVAELSEQFQGWAPFVQSEQLSAWLALARHVVSALAVNDSEANTTVALEALNCEVPFTMHDFTADLLVESVRIQKHVRLLIRNPTYTAQVVISRGRGRLRIGVATEEPGVRVEMARRLLRLLESIPAIERAFVAAALTRPCGRDIDLLDWTSSNSVYRLSSGEEFYEDDSRDHDIPSTAWILEKPSGGKPATSSMDEQSWLNSEFET
jgi:hypothetical protein